jgi:hypothetical protein
LENNLRHENHNYQLWASRNAEGGAIPRLDGKVSTIQKDKGENIKLEERNRKLKGYSFGTFFARKESTFLIGYSQF